MRISVYLILFITGAVYVQGQTSKGDSVTDGRWELVWHDEFDGDGAVDSTYWNYELGFVRNEEYQWYRRENVVKRNGILFIEGRKDSVPNPYHNASSNDWRHSRKYATCTSGSINTRGKFCFQYGKLEVRARIPCVVGSWPAIWTLGIDKEWPSNGEIDVMEYYHIDDIPHILANAAWGNDRRFDAVWNSARIEFSHFTDKDPYWYSKFHIWTMNWDSEHIELSLDGEVLNTIDLSKTVNGRIGSYMNPFHQPHYILLNLAIGGINGGEPQADSWPMRYEVDYVRVYKASGNK